MSASLLWEAAALGRLLYTHALDPKLAVAPAVTGVDLLVFREAAGIMPVIKIKIWRVADRQS